MTKIMQTIPVKGTVSEIQGWIQDWRIYNDKVHLPIHSMLMEDGKQKLYWHRSGISAGDSEISFTVEHVRPGFLS